MTKTKELNSVNKLRKDLKQSMDLYQGLLFVTALFNKFEGDNPTKPAPEEAFQKFLDSNSFLQNDPSEQFKSINVLGFVKLFSDLESFMYELLVELYNQHPESIPSDKKINVSEIIGFKSKSSVQTYIIDQIAIGNSYDLNIWERTLSKSFGIELFESDDDKKMLELLNVIRNMLMHSGGKTNSKIYRELVRLFPEGESKDEFEPSHLDWIHDEKTIQHLYYMLSKIANKIESHFQK